MILSRLYETTGGSAGTTRFLYDGDALIGEYNGGNTLLRRFVHGPGADVPLIWYEGGVKHYFSDFSFLRAWCLVSSLWCNRRGNPKNALKWLNRVERRGPLQPFEIAYKSTLLMQMELWTDARHFLELAERETSGLSTSDDKYVSLFCRYYLSLLDLDRRKAEEIRIEALKVQCRRGLKRWLPLDEQPT